MEAVKDHKFMGENGLSHVSLIEGQEQSITMLYHELGKKMTIKVHQEIKVFVKKSKSYLELKSIACITRCYIFIRCLFLFI